MNSYSLQLSSLPSISDSMFVLITKRSITSIQSYVSEISLLILSLLPPQPLVRSLVKNIASSGGTANSWSERWKIHYHKELFIVFYTSEHGWGRAGCWLKGVGVPGGRGSGLGGSKKYQHLNFQDATKNCGCTSPWNPRTP